MNHGVGSARLTWCCNSFINKLSRWVHVLMDPLLESSSFGSLIIMVSGDKLEPNGLEVGLESVQRLWSAAKSVIYLLDLRDTTTNWNLRRLTESDERHNFCLLDTSIWSLDKTPRKSRAQIVVKILHWSGDISNRSCSLMLMLLMGKTLITFPWRLVMALSSRDISI